jgi:SprT protein
MQMTQPERNRSILSKYVPEGTEETLVHWIYHFDFKLKIKKSRSSKYGDYRPPYGKPNHHITINNDLNRYAFLITLVHEVAHLTCWQKHKDTVRPHGEEWKYEYKTLMQPFLNEQVFPADVLKALRNYMGNPAASSCSDLSLQRVLKKYDIKEGVVLLEQLPAGSVFSYNSSGQLSAREKKCGHVFYAIRWIPNALTCLTRLPR